MRNFLPKLRPFRLLGVLVLGYVLYIVDLNAVIAQLRQIGIFAAGGAVAAFTALVSFRCWRWVLLVRSAGAQTSALASIVACNASIWMGLATPGRVGEFGRGLDLAHRTGKGLAETSALVLFDLVLDLFAYVVMSAAGVALLAMDNDRAGAMLLFTALVLAGFFCLVFMRVFIAAAARWLPWSSKLLGVSTLLPLLASNLDRGKSWQIAVATAGAYLSYCFMIAALVAPMRLELTITDTLTIVGLVGVSSAIPITYFGFGTREVTLIWYLSQFGLGKETAVAVSFSFLLAQLIGIAVSLAISLLLRLAGQTIDGIEHK